MWMAWALDVEEEYFILIDGAPWSKSRPRFARNGRVYPKKDDVDAEARTSWFMKSVVKQPFRGNVGMVCLFYRPNHQRIDTDNLLKHVCDAANNVLWLDDSQATAVAGTIELDSDNPRTIILVGSHVSTLKRGVDDTKQCPVCGGTIRLSTRLRVTNVPITCSRKCANIFRGYESLEKLVVCPQCNQGFRRRTATQKLCSETCRTQSLANRNKNATPWSECVDCGKTLSHKRGGRCRECWKLSRPARKVSP